MIDHFIITNKIQPMKKWSERRLYDEKTKQLLRNVREMVAKIRKILSILSGGDINEMLIG